VGLESKVNFWKKIYSEYSTSHAVIHDMDNLDIIYEIAYFEDGLKKISRRTRERKLERIKRKYRKMLLQIARNKDPATLDSEAKRVYNLVKTDFKKASRRIRVQIGQKDRFRGGLEVSGMYQDQMNQIFNEAKLPLELTVLPHVESSFQVNAYSSAGAAGIWQFTRGTGRIFMKVGYDVDERRDPILSTRAAAKLLKKNFEALQSWPLAITAYNHGTQGMIRAKRKHGGNIVDIISGYRSRTFGFASKNFYAEFLAAMQVVHEKEKYFAGLRFAKPKKMSSLVFKDYVHVNSVISHFGMTRNDILKHNPALRRPVISGQKRIPRGFTFQVPENELFQLKNLYQKIPKRERYKTQIRSKWHTVRRGDTLSGVARRFKTTVNKLYQFNNLSHKNKIYVGQVLRLPQRGNYNNARVPVYKNKKSKKKYSGEMISYKVRRNDNLTKIARRFDTDVHELLQHNGIDDPDQLFPGQRLKLPKEIVVAKTSRNFKHKSKASLSRKKNKNIATKSNRSSLAKAVSQETGDSNNPIGFSDGKTVYNLNKKRPAFLPVAFASSVNSSPEVGIITVDFDETLSHYAEWGNLSIDKILSINGMRNRSRLDIHSKIKVPFTNTDPDSFEERRQEFHKAIQEDFFNNYHINKLLVRDISKGETVWEICNDIYSIPFWLLASYNPDKDINALSAGEPIIIPIISSAPPR